MPLFLLSSFPINNFFLKVLPSCLTWVGGWWCSTAIPTGILSHFFSRGPREKGKFASIPSQGSSIFCLFFRGYRLFSSSVLIIRDHAKLLAFLLSPRLLIQLRPPLSPCSEEDGEWWFVVGRGKGKRKRGEGSWQVCQMCAQ